MYLPPQRSVGVGSIVQWSALHVTYLYFYLWIMETLNKNLKWLLCQIMGIYSFFFVFNHTLTEKQTMFLLFLYKWEMFKILMSCLSQSERTTGSMNEF